MAPAWVRVPALQGKRFISLVILGGVAAIGLVGLGCQGPEGDAKRSQTRLELAKDFLSKHQLEAAQVEADKAIAYQKTNDEAFDVRGLVHYLQALDTQRLLEVDACL